MCGGPTKSVVFNPVEGEIKLPDYAKPFDFKGYPLAMIGDMIAGVVYNDTFSAKFDKDVMKSGGVEGHGHNELKVCVLTNIGEFQGRFVLKQIGNAKSWDEARTMVSKYWNQRGLCKVHKPKVAA